MADNLSITDQRRVIADAMATVERLRSDLSAAADRFRQVAAGTDAGDADFEREQVSAARRSLNAAESFLVESQRTLAALSQGAPVRAPIPAEDGLPGEDEREVDQPALKRRRRAALPDIPRQFPAPDGGWLDTNGKPHAVRIRNHKALCARLSWLWTVCDFLRSSELAAAVDDATTIQPDLVLKLRSAAEAVHDTLDQAHQDFLYLRILQEDGSRVANRFVSDNPFDGTAKDLYTRYNWALKQAAKDAKASGSNRSNHRGGRGHGHSRYPRHSAHGASYQGYQHPQYFHQPVYGGHPCPCNPRRLTRRPSLAGTIKMAPAKRTRANKKFVFALPHCNS